MSSPETCCGKVRGGGMAPLASLNQPISALAHKGLFTATNWTELN